MRPVKVIIIIIIIIMTLTRIVNEVLVSLKI
jgi:hypothetical protein